MSNTKVDKIITSDHEKKHYKKAVFYMKSKSILAKMIFGLPEIIISKYNGGIYGHPGSGLSYYKEGAEMYHEQRRGSSYWKKEQAAMSEFLKEIPDGIKVLDVPFGTGRFTDLFLDKKMEIYGIEKSPDMIEAAKKILNDRFKECNVQVGDALNLPFNENEFDLVVSFRFIPHIVSYEQAIIALNEFHRVSAKYAILQIGEREEKYYRRRLPMSYEKMDSWLYPNEVQKLLGDIGFRVLRKSEPLHKSSKLKYVNSIGKWHGYLCEKI